MRKKSLTLLLCLTLLLSLTTLLDFNDVKADGEGWLSGWTYRKSNAVNNATDAPLNYQLNVTVDYGAGSDSANIVYLDGKCRTDFSDIRFTDNDGSTELDYWLEIKVDSDYALFWFEMIDDVSSENQTVYIYYGNSEAISTSDGSATFPDLFDHFDDEAVGALWATTGTVTETGTELTVDGTSTCKTVAVYDVGKSVRARARRSAEVDYVNLILFSNDALTEYSVWTYYTASSNTHFVTSLRLDGGASDTEVSTLAKDTAYHVWELCRLPNNDVKFFADDVFYRTEANYDDNQQKVWFRSWAGSGAKIVADWVLVRKYVDPEPTHGAWGSEETAADTYTLNYSNISQNGTMLATNANFTVQWTTNGTFADCGFIYGWNFTGTPANDTYTPFGGSGSPQTSNVTKSLGENTTMWGYVVQWQVWANCSGGNWNTTGLQTFSLSAVRMAYTVNENGNLLVNGASQGNETVTHLPTASLEFSAVPDWNYTLDAFTLNSVEYTVNPLPCTFNVTDYTANLEQTLAVSFSESAAASEGVSMELAIAIAMIASIIAGTLIYFLFVRE